MRTLHVDGTEVENSLFAGPQPRQVEAVGRRRPRRLRVAFAVILGLVLIRWLFTLIFVTVRHAADGEPVRLHQQPRRQPRDRRHHPTST